MARPAWYASAFFRLVRHATRPPLGALSNSKQPYRIALGAFSRRWQSSSTGSTSSHPRAPGASPSSSSSSSSSSVNPEEISHFNALAETWWDPHGSSRILHLMNPLRHDFIRDCHASQPDPPSPDRKLRYLDIGCGGGIFAESAARLPTTASVTAIDPSPEVLAVAQRHARKDPALHPSTNPGRLTYLNATIEILPMPEEPYDIVSVFEVVEHVENPANFLDRCGQFVRPGGWLVLSTIARTWVSWFTTNLVAEDILGVVPKGTHDWRKYINEDELRSHFARQSGWSSPRIMGVVYVPGLGWKEVTGSEKVGNYFFAIRKDSD
ncbi:ubiquinone biosynthesis O-methyltransferase [Thozetella sp. PMI_491]|nr:ubiquinone biosynthesis O-methyltransferase [Thozetella sp. PMI_491]